MIIGNFSDTSEAGRLHPRLAEALDWIKARYTTLEVGRAVLESDVIWANVETPLMKAKDAQRLELHQRFIDIHVPVDRDEVIGYLPGCMLRSDGDRFLDDMRLDQARALLGKPLIPVGRRGDELLDAILQNLPAKQ